MSTVELVVDEALGPGLDVTVVDGTPAVVGERPSGIWLGLDRAHLDQSDSGDGTEVPAIVALSASSSDATDAPSSAVGASVRH